MRTVLSGLIAGAVVLAGCATPPSAPDVSLLARQVAAAERAFAKTMADRDHAAFVSFLSEEAIFFSGAQPLRGKRQVAAGWKRFYDTPRAPFSWAPESVEVLDSGTLALSTGPVRDVDGKIVATFTSVWRQEALGVWRIVLDKGCMACACDQK